MLGRRGEIFWQFQSDASQTWRANGDEKTRHCLATALKIFKASLDQV